MNTPQTQIPQGRKALYYGGIALAGVGLLLFLSTFVTFIANFGNFDDFEGQTLNDENAKFCKQCGSELCAATR